MGQENQEIRVVKRVPAGVEAVYRAWTDPEVMRRWQGSAAQAEARVGGRYRREIRAGEATFVHQGEFLALEPPERIVMSFRAGPAEAGEAQDAGETLEVQLRALGPALTELTFSDRWEGEALSEEDQAATRVAWEGWLAGLDELFRPQAS
jgi:uncharacterized protein YndB with AHSA1/START domain